MPGHDPHPFYLALDEEPGDQVTLLALADWFEEHDNADAAACLRWTVKTGTFPFRYGLDSCLTVSSPMWNYGWLWWAVDDPQRDHDWGHPRSCRLPLSLWRALPHTFDYDPAVFKEYPTIRAAYEALFDAWPLAQPELTLSRRSRRKPREGQP